MFHQARSNLLRIEVFFLSTIPRIMAMSSAPLRLPCPLPVLIHRDIQDPMQGVPNSPMGPDPGQKHRRIQSVAQQETPGPGSGIALDMPPGFHRSNGQKTRPAMPFPQPVNAAANAGSAVFDASMTLSTTADEMGKIRILHIKADITVQGSGKGRKKRHGWAMPCSRLRKSSFSRPKMAVGTSLTPPPTHRGWPTGQS